MVSPTVLHAPFELPDDLPYTDLNERLAKAGWPRLGGVYRLISFNGYQPVPEWVSKKPGVYVLLCTKVIGYRYLPSRVAYIGKAEGDGGLRRRLCDHQRGIDACYNTALGSGDFHAAYDWIVAGGGGAVWAPAPVGSVGAPDAREMENILIQEFRRTNGSRPVGNSQN